MMSLKQFYKTHYHPSNAIFITFGDIPAAEHQQRFQEQALHRFEKLDKRIAVTEEQRYSEPQYFEETYAYDSQQDGSGSEDKTHIVIAWLLGNSTNLEDSMSARLLASVLLDNSGSPLQKGSRNNRSRVPRPHPCVVLKTHNWNSVLPVVLKALTLSKRTLLKPWYCRY
jgi:Zn-dependent M16 (insulinase) family peptidase